MKRVPSKRIASLVTLIFSCIWFPTSSLLATDWVQLTAENWHDFVPQGKEVDAIYGDYAFRNDKILAIIARPSPLRNANLTIRDIGGFVWI